MRDDGTAGPTAAELIMAERNAPAVSDEQLKHWWGITVRRASGELDGLGYARQTWSRVRDAYARELDSRYEADARGIEQYGLVEGGS